MLTIHINENWLVFCVFSDDKLYSINKVGFLEKKSESFILKSIKKFLKTYSKNSNSPDLIKLIYYNNQSSLVPKELFDEKNSLNYLKYNNKINFDDFAANDSLINDEIINVYIPYVKINNYIFEKFNSFKYYHYSTLLIEEFRKRINSSFNELVFLNINDKFIDLIYFKKNKLNFYNSFNYKSNEDILYYLLFSLDQLSLDKEKKLISCYGKITLDSELYELLYSYIKNIEIQESKFSDNDEYNNLINSNFLLNIN